MTVASTIIFVDCKRSRTKVIIKMCVRYTMAIQNEYYTLNNMSIKVGSTIWYSNCHIN